MRASRVLLQQPDPSHREEWCCTLHNCLKTKKPLSSILSQSVLPLPDILQRASCLGPRLLLTALLRICHLFLQMKMSKFLFACSLLVVSFETESCVVQVSCWSMVDILKNLPLLCLLPSLCFDKLSLFFLSPQL